MTVHSQKDRALQFRQMHTNPPLLVLPNAWDAASARIFEQAGFRAIATTSSGVAASLGNPDGEKISLHMLVETVENITRNIEDSNKRRPETLLDTSYQVELIKAIRELGRSMDIPLVINARTDVFLLAIGDPGNRFKEAVLRMNIYRQAGADCLFPIGISDAHTITELIHAVNSPLNILAGSATPSLTELAQLRVARVSFGSGPMRAVLAHLQHIVHEWIEYGTFTNMTERTISGAQLRSLFE